MLLPLSLVWGLLAHSSLGSTPIRREYDSHQYYVLEHLPNSGMSLADTALALGVEVVEQAGQLRNHWVVRVEKQARDTGADPVLQTLDSLRSRAHLGSRDLHARGVVSSVRYLEPQTLRQRVKRAPIELRAPIGVTNPEGNETSLEVATRVGIQDPLFSEQWHLVNDEYPEVSAFLQV